MIKRQNPTAAALSLSAAVMEAASTAAAANYVPDRFFSSNVSLDQYGNVMIAGLPADGVMQAAGIKTEDTITALASNIFCGVR